MEPHPEHCHPGEPGDGQADRKRLSFMVTKTESEIRQDVQGLRAVAVLAVLLFHLERSWLPGGFLGVDLFFVISGFVITRILMRGRPGWSGLGRFYVRRFQRIVPAYAVVVLATTLAAALLLTEHDFGHYWASYQHALTFTANRYFSGFGDYFAPQSTELPLLHLWSISVEMQFYFLLPLVIFVLPREHVGRFVAALLLLSLVYAVLKGVDDENSSRAYMSLSGRIPEFLVGASTAASRLGEQWREAERRWAAWVGVVAIATGLLLLTESTRWLAQLSLLPCVGAALLIAAQTSAPNRVLASRFPVWVGAISYSLYLWHWPLLAFVRYLFGAYVLTPASTLAWISATFATAFLSYRSVEVRFRSGVPRTGDAAALIALAGVAIAVAMAAPALNAIIGPVHPDRELRYAAADKICHGVIVGDCIRGARSGKDEWLLLGDSHAAQLNMFFDVVGQENGFKVRAITASSCVTVPGFDAQRIPQFAREACMAQIEHARPYIDRADVIALAGMWQYHASSEDFWKAIERFLYDMNSHEKRVIVFAQIPMLDIDPIRAMRFGRLGIEVPQTRRQDWAVSNCRMQRLAEKFEYVTFFDLSDHPLFQAAPRYEGSTIYYDQSHLNERGATLYGESAKAMLVPGALNVPPARRCEGLTQ